jgi:hypothetical protein
MEKLSGRLTFVNIPRSGISICLGVIPNELDEPGKVLHLHLSQLGLTLFLLAG